MRASLGIGWSGGLAVHWYSLIVHQPSSIRTPGIPLVKHVCFFFFFIPSFPFHLVTPPLPRITLHPSLHGYFSSHNKCISSHSPINTTGFPGPNRKRDLRNQSCVHDRPACPIGSRAPLLPAASYSRCYRPLNHAVMKSVQSRTSVRF